MIHMQIPYFGGERKCTEVRTGNKTGKAVTKGFRISQLPLKAMEAYEAGQTLGAGVKCLPPGFLTYSVR